jgi:hypothetical protein
MHVCRIQTNVAEVKGDTVRLQFQGISYPTSSWFRIGTLTWIRICLPQAYVTISTPCLTVLLSSRAGDASLAHPGTFSGAARLERLQWAHTLSVDDPVEVMDSAGRWGKHTVISIDWLPLPPAQAQSPVETNATPDPVGASAPPADLAASTDTSNPPADSPVHVAADVEEARSSTATGLASISSTSASSSTPPMPVSNVASAAAQSTAASLPLAEGRIRCQPLGMSSIYAEWIEAGSARLGRPHASLPCKVCVLRHQCCQVDPSRCTCTRTR